MTASGERSVAIGGGLSSSTIITGAPSTADLTSVGFGFSSAGAGGTIVYNGVRFWVEG